MRTKIKKIASMFIIGLLFTATHTQAQRDRGNNNYDRNDRPADHQDQRSNNNNYNNNNSEWHRDDRNRYDNHHSYQNNNQVDHRQSYEYYDHSYHNGYSHQPWAHHNRIHSRARYIYFRNADVYYDCNRNTYITISGRNWSVSTALPQHMGRTDMTRAVYEDVEYMGDDIYQYHSQRYYGR